MHRAGKPSHTPKTPSVAPAAAPVKPHTPPNGLQQGEGSYSGTGGYDGSVKSFLETAGVEKDARNAAPDGAAEAGDIETGRKGGTKSSGPDTR